MKKTLLAAAFLALAPLSVQAATPNFNYVELSYINMNAEASGGPSVDTWGFAGSAELGDSNFYVLGSHQFKSDIAHYTHTHTDFSITNFGLGYHWDLSEATALSVEAGVGNETWESENNQFIAVGLRHAFNDSFEMGGKATHRVSDYMKDTLFLNVYGQYNFNDNFGINLGYTYGDYDGGSESSYDATFDSTYQLGFRYSF
jgi:opacity protein-like surface antigen